MKRIVFMLPNLFAGGAERVTVILANALSRNGFDVSLVTAQGKGDLEHQLESSITLHALGYQKTIFSILGVRRLIKEMQPDIVFSTTHRMNVVVYLANLLVLKKWRVFLRLPSSPKSEIENGKINWLYHKLYSVAYQQATCVVAQTPEMREQVVKYFGVEKEKVRVLINPIDTEYIDRKLRDAGSPFVGGINIVAAGRLVYEKGYDVLIDAFKEVAEKKSDFRLHIIGADKGCGKELAEQVKRLDLESKVIFHGYQENPYQFFANCDLFVLSSRWEGLPNAVLENLYIGKPVAVTKCVSILEDLIDDGENGFLIDVGDSEQLETAMLNYSQLKPKPFNPTSFDAVKDLFLKT